MHPEPVLEFEQEMRRLNRNNSMYIQDPSDGQQQQPDPYSMSNLVSEYQSHGCDIAKVENQNGAPLGANHGVQNARHRIGFQS